MREIRVKAPERVSRVTCHPFLETGRVVQTNIAFRQAWAQPNALPELSKAGLIRQPWRGCLIIDLLDRSITWAVVPSKGEEASVGFGQKREVQLAQNGPYDVPADDCFGHTEM